MRGTFYFYKTITKYSKIHFSKFTAVISQLVNAKTSFVFLCTNYGLHSCGLITMCAFKKYYFLINSLKLKITEFFQFVQGKKKYVCVSECVTVLTSKNVAKMVMTKQILNPEDNTGDGCDIGS